MSWHFASRYRPRYARTLTYMLQASEYNPREYLAWYARTHDFASVEKRGKLKRTHKANVIELTLFALLAALYLGSFTLAMAMPGITGILAALAGLLATPYLAAYLILLPLLLLRFGIQYPLEYRQVEKTRRYLATVNATKIAVAGSYGKTSMREILRTVLSQGKRASAPPHSYNTPLGISQFVKGLTGNEEVLVFELGEYYPGDVRKLARVVQPQIGVIAGINEAHLSKFKHIERTVSTIFELADYLGEQPVYVNGDSSLARAAARPGHIIYSRDGVDGTLVRNATTGLDGTSFELVMGRKVLHLKSQLLGLHQVGPLVAAADIARKLGLSIEQIEAGVAAVEPFAHRLQPRTDSDGVIILDDSYNGNPDGVSAVIAFLASLHGHKRIYVTPGLVEMGTKTAEVHREIGHQLADAGIETVILIRNSATPDIEKGLIQAGFKGEVVWFNTGPEANAALPNLTVKGDVVLLQNDWPDQYA